MMVSVPVAGGTLFVVVSPARTIAFLLLAFFVGSIPFGLIVGRLFFRRDIRTSGSGNIGAANALRTFGRGAGIAVLLLDALKGALPVLAFRTFVASEVAGLHEAGPASDSQLAAIAVMLSFTIPLAGLAAVLGHCYSPWLRFRGGKGVATFLGATIALSPPAGLAFAVVWAAVALPTGFASAASLAATVAAGAVLVVAARGAWPTFVYGLGCALVIFWRHRENLGRLRAGTETKTSLLKRG